MQCNDRAPLMRQLFVASATWLAAASIGGGISFPMVLMHQLKADNDTSAIRLDLDTASWIGSIQGLAGLPCVLAPVVMQWKGRRFVFIAACLLQIIGWGVIYAAEDATALLVGESFHGLGSTSALPVSMATLTEMMPPKNRHRYAQIYGIVHMTSLALNGLLTQYVHWRNISIIMCVPAVVAVLAACMWPESHHWLAIKGEFDKCEKSFIWIRGTDDVSLKELHELVNAQHKRVKQRKSRNKINLLKQLFIKLTRRQLYLPFMYMFVLQYLFYWSGSISVIMNSVDLIKQTTQNEDIGQFGGLVVNVPLCAGYVLTASALGSYVNKKPLLLSCTCVIVLSTTAMSMVSYLQTIDVLPKKSLLFLYPLIFYMFALGLGFYPICYLLGTELIPVKHRGIGGAISELYLSVLHTTSVKFAPYLFLYINIWGTFLLYAINALICGIIIWRYIPDTTGRTLQEIENYFNNGNFDREHQTGNSEVVTPIL